MRGERGSAGGGGVLGDAYQEHQAAMVQEEERLRGRGRRNERGGGVLHWERVHTIRGKHEKRYLEYTNN